MELKDLSVKELKEYQTYLKSGRLKGIVDRNEPFDYKFSYHLVRLSYECQMILEEGDIDLQRYNEHLKAIRRGDISEEDIRKWFSEKERFLTKLYEESKLQHKPNIDQIRTLLLNCLESHYGNIDSLVEIKDRYKIILNEISEILRRNKL